MYQAVYVDKKFPTLVSLYTSESAYIFFEVAACSTKLAALEIERFRQAL